MSERTIALTNSSLVNAIFFSIEKVINISHRINAKIESLRTEDAEIHVECLKEAYPNAEVKENAMHQGVECRIVVDTGYSSTSFGLQEVKGQESYQYRGYEGGYARNSEHLGKITQKIKQEGAFPAKKFVSEATKSGMIGGPQSIKSQTKPKRIEYVKEDGSTVGGYETTMVFTADGVLKKKSRKSGIGSRLKKGGRL